MAWERAKEASDKESFNQHVATPLARLAAEAWIALEKTSEHSRAVRLAYVHRRVQNAWLLQVWPAIDRRFAQPTSPDRFALYLTLGFMQATTTWKWPATDVWRQLLGL